MMWRNRRQKKLYGEGPKQPLGLTVRVSCITDKSPSSGFSYFSHGLP